ncbi:MAG: hypothetical protein ACREN7_03295 [Candidatus Dormibacteria bacterium]
MAGTAAFGGPHTLVLDEATSILDPRSARAPGALAGQGAGGQDGDQRLPSPGQTAAADLVVMLNGERVGSHHQLLGEGGRYADLWRADGGEMDDTSAGGGQP